MVQGMLLLSVNGRLGRASLRVADAVVRGKSSEALLDGYAGTFRPQPDAPRGSGQEPQQAPSATGAGQAASADLPADRFRYRQVDDAGGGNSKREGENAAFFPIPLWESPPGRTGSTPSYKLDNLDSVEWHMTTSLVHHD
jgi:hypothetical protein